MKRLRWFLFGFLIAWAGCGGEPLAATPPDMAKAADLAPAACRAPRYAWIQNDGGPTCCGGEGARCCAGADPCDPGLRCEINYTSTCWRVEVQEDGGGQ